MQRRTNARLQQIGLLAACAVIGSAYAQAHAANIWTGATSGVWNLGSNWDDGNVPATGGIVTFGAATNYTITSDITRAHSFLFTSDAGANYSLSEVSPGDMRFNNITVQGSANATNHTIGSGFRYNAPSTFDVQSTQTSLTFSGVDMGSVVSFTKTGIGTLIFATNPLNVKRFIVNAGTVDIRSDLGTNGGGSEVRLSGSGGIVTNSTGTMRTLTLRGTDTQTYNGLVTGNLNLFVGETGAATSVHQILNGNNTYAGTTNVHGGTLTVNGTTSGQGNYIVSGTTSSVSDDGLMRGTGSIGLASGKTFTVGNTSATASLGILKPGLNDTDTGTLSVAVSGTGGKVLITGKSVLRFDIGALGASDKLAITGDFELGAATTKTLQLTSLAGAFDGSMYTLISWTGTALNPSGFFDTITVDGTLTLADKGYTINYNPNSITLSIIPEPASLALLGLGSLLMLPRRAKKA